MSALDIDPSERLQAAKNLFTVLHELELVKRWGALFAIALLRKAPTVVIALWHNDTHINIAKAFDSKKNGVQVNPAGPRELQRLEQTILVELSM